MIICEDSKTCSDIYQDPHVLVTQLIHSLISTINHMEVFCVLLWTSKSLARTNNVSSCPFLITQAVYRWIYYCVFISDLMLFLLLFNSFAIHMSVERVYTGMKSPTKGMNSIMFTAVDILLLVILYSKLTMIASRTSPITGIPNKGAAI